MTKLNELKEGEDVFYSGRLHYDSGSIFKITRITNTMIICDRYKFRRDNGNIIGNTDRWHFPRIEVLTEELREKVYRRILITKIDKFNFEKLTYQQLKEVWAIIGKMAVIKPHTQATSDEVVA